MNIQQFDDSTLPKWQLELINKYPLIYRERNSNFNGYFKGKDENYCNLRFGFEFDEGWAGIVDGFSLQASELVKKLRKFGYKKDKCFVHSVIFKEKYATLRFQGDVILPDPFYDLFMAYVDQLEEKSKNICEICGQFGQISNKGAWLKTVCKKHAKELGYKYKE